MVGRNLLVWVGAVCAAVGMVWAGNDLVPGQLIVDEKTIRTIGLRLLADGDDNDDSRASFSYRAVGESDWRDGPELLRVHGEDAGIDGWVCGHLFAGSLFQLEPGTDYEIRVQLTDPDGISGQAEYETVAATRPVPPHQPGEQTLHVYPSCGGDDRLTPCFNDIVDAAQQADPGDVVFIHSGFYPRAVIDLRFLSNRATSAEQPITFRGERQDLVTFDGGVSPSGGASQAFFRLTGTRYLQFERFTVANAGTAFSATNAVGLTIRSVKMDGVWGGIGGTDSINGEDRLWTITDNEIIGWNPLWYPYDTRENSISHTGIRIYGKGHVVEFNRVSRFWDCIAHSDTGGGQVTNSSVDWADPPSLNIDINNNDLDQCYDDAIEADYGYHNIRIFRNRMVNGHTALSAQPFYGGPVYFLYNTGYNLDANSFKFHNQPAGIEAYHNTLAVHEFSWESDSGWLNARVRNNLLMGDPSSTYLAVGTGTPSHPHTVIDYNGYTDTVSTRLIKWNRAPYLSTDYRNYNDLDAFFQDEGYEEHGRMVDYSGFEDAPYPGGEGSTYDPEDIDMSLRPAAGAVDAGVELPGINDGYLDAAPDMGAHERGGEQTVWGPRPGAVSPPGEASDPDGPAAPLTIALEGEGFRVSWSTPPDGGLASRYLLYTTPLDRPFDGSCENDLGTGTTAWQPTLTSNCGFVVVAGNDAGEGPRGEASNGDERAPGYGPDLCP